MEKAVETVAECAGAGAKLVVFPEAWLPEYPTWIWRLRPGGDMALGNAIQMKLMDNAVDIAKGGLDRLCDATARKDAAASLVEREAPARHGPG